MTISYSIPVLLHKISPVLKYGGIIVCILNIFLEGVSGIFNVLLGLANSWILAILCDAVVDLYAHAEKTEISSCSEE